MDDVYSDGDRLDQRRTCGFYTIEVYQVPGIARLPLYEATLLLGVFSTLRIRLSMRRLVVGHDQSDPFSTLDYGNAYVHRVFQTLKPSDYYTTKMRSFYGRGG